MTGEGEDIKIVGANFVVRNDSSIFTNITDPFVQTFNFTDLYSIAAPPTPTPDKPDTQTSWLQKNIVLVVVASVILFAVIVVLSYCFCKKKPSYTTALYDDDKLMKARI